MAGGGGGGGGGGGKKTGGGGGGWFFRKNLVGDTGAGAPRGFRGKGGAKRGGMRRVQKLLHLRPTPDDEPQKPVTASPEAIAAAAQVRGAAKAAGKEAAKAAPKAEPRGKSPATAKSQARAA